MALNADALTSVDRVKTFLDIDSSDYDSLIEFLVNSMSEYIKSQTGAILKQATISNELYDGKGTQFLVLKNGNASSVTSLEYRTGNVGVGASWQVLETDGYALEVGKGVIYRPAGFACGKMNYRVTYVCGNSSIPSDLELLCVKLVSRVFDQRRSQGKIAEGIDGASINWASNLDAIDKATLQKYKNWGF